MPVGDGEATRSRVAVRPIALVWIEVVPPRDTSRLLSCSETQLPCGQLAWPRCHGHDQDRGASHKLHLIDIR